ncbi:hypothetical protein ACLBOM_37425 [Escherichia coli]
MNFTDQNGAPWPVAAPPINGNEKGIPGGVSAGLPLHRGSGQPCV